MYYIVESPKVINVPINDIGHVKCIKANKDYMFLCAITCNDIMIWYTSSNHLIAFHQRADNSISIHGENHVVEWNTDSTKIAVMTTKGYLIYYKIIYENEFVLTEVTSAHTAWNDSLFSNQIQYQNPLLSCKITHEFSIHIQHAHKYMFCFNDEIYIPLLNGKIIKVPWNDQARHDHFFLHLHRLYFKIETDGELFKLKDNIYISDFEMGVDDGFLYLAGVLSDAGGIYLYTDSSNVFRGLIAKTMVNERALLHKCVAVNPQYRLLTFGCRNGVVVAYHQPDDYTSLQISNYYNNNETSSVTSLKWSPDYKCLTVLYENGTFSLFSVFGSILYDSKEHFYYNCVNQSLRSVKNLEFGIEGYTIWLYVQSNETTPVGRLFQVKTLKSAVLNNCSMSNIDHIALNGEREVYVCLNTNKINTTSIEKIQNSNKKLPQKYQYPSLKLGGNTIWQVINVPLTYISTNYPIRMTSIDAEGKHLAVAGTRGFTHYSFMTRKWKIFGNADQEKDIRITGGLLWWKEFICMSCVNMADNKDEIRFYSRNSNLDNSYSKISKTSCQILQMSIFRNLLILFGVDCKVQVFGLEGGKDSTSKIILNKLIEIPIENYVFNNPYLVVSISLCPLYIGNCGDVLKNNIESNNSTMKSVLVNIAGNLLMFQPDLDGLLSIPEDLNKTKPFTSMPPIMLSSCVENHWVVTDSLKQKLINQLMNFSLWMYCGAHGMKLWLPLSGEETRVEQSNRIILNFALNFYPINIQVNEAILIGAQSESTCLNLNSYCHIQKTTQLFMPFILEGLIRKKLFLDANKISSGYRYLPYFMHIIELLVHKILEEEANLSETEKPNFILPNVISFISEFPEYLKIISCCTRKSEVAIWPYLFSVVGHPRDLYEKCLQLNDLETAASYLVVIQNTENSNLCEKFASMLLKSSLVNSQWDLVREITRFLSSIDPADYENEVFNHSNESQSSSHVESPKNYKLLSQKNSVNNSTKTSSSSLNDSKLKHNTSSKSLTKKVSFIDDVKPPSDFELYKKTIDTIIYEYAQELFKSFRLKQLFEMFSNLSFLNIEKWLTQFQQGCVIDNYVDAISNVHFDFNWPYPILVNQYNKTNSFVIDSADFKVKENHVVSDFIYDKISENGKESKALDDHENCLYDFDLMAQELANTGSNHSKKQLLYLMDTFLSTKFYEWVFVLAIVLKKFPVINEVMRLIKTNEIPPAVSASIKKGLQELEEWSHHECCGYRSIVKKINNL